MKYTRKEAKRIVGKRRSDETLTDAEKEYFVQVTKKAMKQLPDSVGSWILVASAIMLSAADEQKLVDEVLDELFEDVK